MSIGQRLKTARKLRGLSQNALAEAIGASRGVVTNIEHDKIDTPQAMVTNAICKALNINSQWLMTGNGPMEMETQTSENCSENSIDCGSDGGSANGDILSEINTYVQALSANEQLYILETIKSYISHFKE